MPAGRPTKYTPELLETAIDYLGGGYEAEGSVIPSAVGLSLVLNISRQTVYEWGADETKKEFTDILERIQAKQHEILMTKGLIGDFNAAITKLALGKHGYHDKQELSGSDGTPLNITFVGVSPDAPR